MKITNYTDMANHLIVQKNMSLARKRLALIDAWDQNGTNEIRNIIANELVLPVTRCMELQERIINNVLTLHLILKYYQQINTTGI